MRFLTVALLAAAALVGHTVSGASSYDPKIAMDALFYCKSASCQSAAIGNWSCPSCGFNPAMKEVNVFTERDTQAYVGFDVSAGNIVVAFRGSSNLQNWIDDFTFELVPYPHCNNGCMVHKGFYEVYTALSVDLIPQVRAALQRHPNSPLFVTGHSLGAAVSLLAALDLYAETKDREVFVYNFGEPRVGDANFTAWAVNNLPTKTQFRVTHHEDPVPHLPPLEFGFIHVPHEIFYDNDGNTTWIDCNDSYLAEDKTCSDKYPLPLAFGDHTHYLGVHTGCDVTEDALRVRKLYF